MMNKYIIGMIIGVLGSGFSVIGSGVRAEPILKPQAPLVYEYNLKGPLTVESETITTTGTIKTISAFADSEGEVRLEISANGGSAYTRIINGQPLSDRFIPGNQLRVRANIAEGSMLKKLILGFTDSSGASRMSNNPQPAKFKFHKPIYISGGSEELFNYPLKIKIEKEIFPQGIYFTAADGESPLNYYAEEEGLWVKVPEIPKEGTMIYLYYGAEHLEPRTENRGDGKKVFSFFDDFNGTALDEEKWQVRPELKGDYILEDGYLRLTGCSIIARNFKMKNGILEFKAKAEKDSAIQAIVHGAKAPHSIYPSEEMVYSSGYPGAEHTIAINDVAKLNIGKAIEPLTDYIYQVILNDLGVIFERYGRDYTKEAEIRFMDSYRNEAGYIGLKADGTLPGGGSVYFDWVRVRPYTEVEPRTED